jgi:Fe2+ or Zn2+ uptake regulation protein
MTPIRKTDLDNKAIELLRDKRLKVTKPRITLLRFLMREHGPFSTDDILSRLSKTALDRVTVYRTLSSFENSGLVVKCDLGDGIARYEAKTLHNHKHSHHDHHHHVVCRNCKRIESIDICLPNNWEKQVKSLGYKDISHSITVQGLCQKCAA